MDDDYPNIISAIVEAAKAMPSLDKGNTNAHGGYQFVSIDNYYEVVAKVALAQGLTWKVREEEAKIISVEGRNGPASALFIKYYVDVMHPSGEIWNGFFSASIVHPLQGAQTAGSAMSYLVKLFLRTTFHVVTGEADADATDGSAFDMGAKPAAVAKKVVEPVTPPPPTRQEAYQEIENGEKARTTLALAEVGLSTCTTKALLDKFWVDNEGEFKKLKKLDPKGYAELVQEFKRKNGEFV